MIQELHPQLSLKVVFLKSWWLLVLVGIFISIIIDHTADQFHIPSRIWLDWVVKTNLLFLVISAAIFVMLLVLIYLDLSAYLQIENGFLERRWRWKRGGSSNRIKLTDMQRCTICRDVLTVGRGIRNFYGFVFDPKDPKPIWQKLRIDMPAGVDSINQEKFLNTIRSEMKGSR